MHFLIAELTFASLLNSMALKITLLFLFILSIASLLVLYAFKMAIHFKFLRLKDRKKVGATSDFFYRAFNDKKDAERWKKAWMIFPLMFAVVLEEERTELNGLLKEIKKINFAIYSVLIVAMLVTVYAAKAFPEGIF